MAVITLIPAYGREYKTLESMLADWKAGKDFRVGTSGPYCSVRDLDHMKRIYWAEDIVLCERRHSLAHTVSRGLGF